MSNDHSHKSARRKPHRGLDDARVQRVPRKRRAGPSELAASAVLPAIAANVSLHSGESVPSPSVILLFRCACVRARIQQRQQQAVDAAANKNARNGGQY